MKITNTAVNRVISSIMVYLAIIILGVVSVSKTPIDLFPDIDFPIIVIITDYTGAGPKEVESNVSKPIEDSLAGINNIEKISSTSKEGSSMVRLEFAWGTDMGAAASDVRERIDIIKKFLPTEVSTPMVLKFDVSMMPIMTIAVMGDRDSSKLKEYAENELKNQFEQIDGVASAAVIGGSENEVKVEIIKNRLDAYGISIDTIVNMLRIENMNVAGGDIESTNKVFTIRTKGEFGEIDDIKNVIVDVKNNTPVYIKDIANVYFAPKKVSEVFRLNGKNGIAIQINKQSDKNTVLTSRKVMEKMTLISKNLPKGITIAPIFNSAEFIENSLNNLVSSAVQGGIISILVVFLFLRNFRAALILGLSIPISIITTFIVTYYFGITLNMMSMGGLAIGVGMLIDNSIVVLDNIFSYREKGSRPTEAAKLGADEVGMAIVASTLTTVAVFVPFLFTQGLAGQLFKQMALTISFSLFASIFVALTLVPMMSAHFIKDLHPKHEGKFAFMAKISNWSEAKLKFIEEEYSIGIKWALQNRKKVILIVVGATVFGLLLLIPTGMEFLPEQDEGRIAFRAQLPIGTNLTTTTEAALKIEEIVKNTVKPGEMRMIRTYAGRGEGFIAAFSGGADNVASYELMLVPLSKRSRKTYEIRKALRAALDGKVPGVTMNFNIQSGAFGGGAPITIEVYGHDFDKSAEFVKEIEAAIKDVPGLKDTTVSREDGLPEKVISINRDKASKMGLNASVIANIIKNSFAGKVATTYRYGGDEYDINVQFQASDRKTIDDIKNITVKTPLGVMVPLGNIIDITSTEGPGKIQHKKQQRVTYINCQAEGRALNAVVADVQKKIDMIVKPKNFHIVITGAFEDMKETFTDLALALILAIILVYIIMAMQFESLGSPFVVIFTIPTLAFGVMVFLFLTGTTFNVVSFMGVLMLAGIVVNNAIVLVDYTNILVARGSNVFDALIEAGRRRLRPILMTTLTTIFGLVPMALGIGEGSELTKPLARAVIGGMSSSFLFTLFFIPVVYIMFEEFKTKLRSRMKRLKV